MSSISNARGLSKLQRQILAIALRHHQQDQQAMQEGKQKRERLQFVTADALYEIYGFPPKNRFWCRDPIDRNPCKQNFCVKEVGQQRYNAAKMSVYKAVRRLVDRGLVKAMEGMLSKRYAGVMLTDEGKAAAEAITANLLLISETSKPSEETANLLANLPAS